MNVEEMKAHLRALLHQRDMLRFERDSMELFDKRDEMEEEIWREIMKKSLYLLLVCVLCGAFVFFSIL